MWPFGPWRKVQRTCLDCGQSWTLDAGLAHLRPRRPRPAVRARNTQVLKAAFDSLDQQLETIRETRTCPRCSSEHFKDRRSLRVR